MINRPETLALWDRVNSNDGSGGSIHPTLYSDAWSLYDVANWNRRKNAHHNPHNSDHYHDEHPKVVSNSDRLDKLSHKEDIYGQK